MGKPLSEMTLEELWQLFPIQLVEHNPDWRNWYEEEKESLCSILGGCIARVDHIGSTCVDGLIAKPIVDILLQIKPGIAGTTVKNALVADGWLLMAENPNMNEFALNKGYTPEGFSDRVFHLHVRRQGDWDQLLFRNYLVSHPDARIEYATLKRQLLARYEHNRDAYTAAKTEFVKSCLVNARAEKG